jgi:hypothetical protein
MIILRVKRILKAIPDQQIDRYIEQREKRKWRKKEKTKGARNKLSGIANFDSIQVALRVWESTEFIYSICSQRAGMRISSIWHLTSRIEYFFRITNQEIELLFHKDIS